MYGMCDMCDMNFSLKKVLLLDHISLQEVADLKTKLTDFEAENKV